MKIKIIGSRPKKMTLISKLICWYENKTNRWDFYKYVVFGKYEKKDISHIIYLIDDTVYEAVREGFLSCKYEDWLKENHRVWEQDIVKRYFFSEERCVRFEDDCKAFVVKKTKYGTLTLVGIIINDKTDLTWFADGTKRVICSEVAIYLLKDYIGALTKPADYYTPLDIIKLLKMEYVFNGENF